jgi:hypothetical protein
MKSIEIVFAADLDVEDISKTSGHFEWASTNTKNDFPRKGPAKSIWCVSIAGEFHM